ncbi:MAG: hypothetical protein IPG44_11745 [Anaerolineales bacterium]|nr:hypothetical protein [Anaerolineales bacterium]
MKLVTVSQMRAIEKEADAKGLSYAQMMENAGRGLAEYLHNLGEKRLGNRHRNCRLGQ